MKKILFLIGISLLISCSITKQIDYSNSFWGTLEDEENYLYTSNSLTSIVDKEIKKGTILFFHTNHDDFVEVYTKNTKKIKDNKQKEECKFYLYKPKYQKLSYQYNKDYATIYELPFAPNRKYILGERGGCYYINPTGNKTYVNRSYCSQSIQQKKIQPEKTTITKKYKSNLNCPTVQCSGRTKKGTRCKNKTSSCSGRCHLH